MLMLHQVSVKTAPLVKSSASSWEFFKVQFWVLCFLWLSTVDLGVHGNYLDDLVIMDQSLDGLLNQFCTWKDSFDSKRLRVNMSKTKILASNPLIERQVNPSKYPCCLCKKGVGSNSIFCHLSKSEIHHRFSNRKGHLRPGPNFKCQKYCQK